LKSNDADINFNWQITISIWLFDHFFWFSLSLNL